MKKSVARRRFVQAMSGGLVVGLAGCMGGGGEEAEGEDGHDDHDDGDHEDDEQGDGTDTEGSEGFVYAFAPNTIAIIDPESGEVVDEITDGLNDEGWGDPRITADYGEIYVIRESPSQVLAIDTDAREIVDEVDIGPDATHMYHPNDEEMWAHSDEEGTFYVIDTDTHEVREIVQAGLEDEGHGKLLYHEDLGSKGYATNVNDPAALIIDLEAYERTGYIELENEDEGTHYKAYAPETGLAYFEHGDVTAVVDSETDEVVEYLDFSGGMYLSPDEQALGVLDGNSIRFLDATSEGSEEFGVVEVDEGPDALRYHEADDGTLYAFTAHTQTDRASVIDVEEGETVETVDIGDIVRPEDAAFLHRTGVAGGGYFISPADADGVVAIVEMDAHEVVDHVEVEEGVDTVQYVGDSGVGYTGRLR
jgi:DNA-binding beta-propeller fold protein YncE